MRRIVATLLAVAAAAYSSLLDGNLSAYADVDCQEIDFVTGECIIAAETAPTPPKQTQDSDPGPQQTGAGSPCVYAPSGNTQPEPVPCTSGAGYWSNELDCYVELVQPQPPPDAPFWLGDYTADGSVYQCTQPQTGTVTQVWLPTPPPASGGGPTPGEVAQLAVDRMELRAIDIGLAPESVEGSVGLVGMPVWMWVRNPDAHTFGPATATASAGGVTVTATAQVHRITWDMGDGTTVSCSTAGTAYQASFGMRTSPDCGHVYERTSADQPDGTYAVTATSDWVVRWEGAGQSGVIRLDGLQRTVHIVIGEAQVLVN